MPRSFVATVYDIDHPASNLRDSVCLPEDEGHEKIKCLAALESQFGPKHAPDAGTTKDLAAAAN